MSIVDAVAVVGLSFAILGFYFGLVAGDLGWMLFYFCCGTIQGLVLTRPNKGESND